MRSKHLTAESEMRGIAYAPQYAAQAIIKLSAITSAMLDSSWAVEPQIRDLVFPLIEPKENHPYGWYRKFEKKKR